MKNIELQKLLATLPPDVEVIFGINDGDEGGSHEVSVKVDQPELSPRGRLREDGLFIYGDGNERIIIFSIDEQYIYEAMRDQICHVRIGASMKPIFPGDKIIRGTEYRKHFRV